MSGLSETIPVAARSNTWVCGRSHAGSAGSISAAGMNVYVLCALCVVRQRYLRRDDHSSRGVISRVVFLIESDRKASIIWCSQNTRGICATDTISRIVAHEAREHNR